jgi:hypothetical protein
MAGTSGRRREMFCLPLVLLPDWLFGVSPNQARHRGAAYGRLILAGTSATVPQALTERFAGEGSEVPILG